MSAVPEQTPTTLKSPAEKKPRNPVELYLVRGGIALLVVLVAVQAHARFGYQISLQKLQHRLATEEDTAVPLLVKDVPGLIVGFPSRSRNEDRHWHQMVYKWRGITQAYEIRMQYDSSETDPAVMGLVTADAPPPRPLVLEDAAPTENTPPIDYAAMAGRGGGMGGGPRPDPMTNDKDGDGRLSKEEAPDRMTANFAEWDANNDGFIDQDEVKAGVDRFMQQRGGGRPPGGEGRRPQRPAAETDQPAGSQDAAPKDASNDAEATEDATADAAKVNPTP